MKRQFQKYWWTIVVMAIVFLFACARGILMPLRNDDFRGFWNEILIVAALMAVIAIYLS